MEPTLSEIQYERRKIKPSDNVGKFHTYLKCRIGIHHQKSISWLDIKVSMYLACFFRKFGYFLLFLSALVQASSGDKNKTLVMEHSKRAKNRQILLKCAKYVLTLMTKLWNWFLVMNSYSTLGVQYSVDTRAVYQYLGGQNSLCNEWI